MRRAASFLSLFILLLAGLARAPAKRLPVKAYTTADGLPRNQIYHIVRDSHGFLWVCTNEGLSRFDGYEFTNYGTEQGLPRSAVLDLIETRSGDYWAATTGGLCRFHPGPQSGPMFRPYRVTGDPKTEHATAVLEDRTGVIWCGTPRGLYRLEPPDSARWIDLGVPRGSRSLTAVHELLEDRQGALWVASDSGLYRLGQDGQTRRYSTKDGLPDDDIAALREDRQGQLWVGCHTGLCRMVPDPGASGRLVARVYTTKDGLSGNFVRSILETSEGRLWFGSFGGLSELTSIAEPDHPHFQNYRSAEGVSDRGINTLAEDRERNLWAGTEGEGAIKISHSGFTSYGLPDGLHDSNITTIFEDLAGDLCVLSEERHGLSINRLDGQRFRATQPRFPSAIEYFGWGWKQTALQDRVGEWWIATGSGLLRFPKVASVEQLARTSPTLYSVRDGLVTDDVVRLFEDSAGDIWVSTAVAGGLRSGLTQWMRAAGSFRDHTSITTGLALVFREDHLGALWIGFDVTGLARYRNGRFEFFTVADGLPKGAINDLNVDRSGRLWIASGEGGLGRIDDPGAPHPRFVTISAAQGLSGNSVHCITEDLSGRIYVGTGHGVDRLEPDGSGIRHYTTADGLSPGEFAAAYRDRHGTLWFATHLGLSQLVPEPDRPRSPPPILITRVSIRGTLYPISALGETHISGPVLSPGQNFIQFDFVGLGFSAGEKLRYQYRLEGAGGEWSAPAENRSVHFASLSPGRYRFLVRALNAPGLASDQPAAVSFTVLPPFWMRWWFVLPAATALAMLLFAAHRYRLARLLELERVRTRIATDLHDDIGASLSHISILSEVARRRAGDVDALAKPLAEIAGASRELLSSMSDIVWSIDPQRDRLRDLVQRMRRFATDVFTASNIEFQFHAPAAELEGKLDPDLRRQVFLIFKESVNNIVRHADCTRVEIHFAVEKGGLVLNVRDDGKGFDVTQPPAGNGLVSMRQRAASLNGSLEIKVDGDRGTRVTLRVPA